jgi:diguanylate cyclase (GGDEF)-like protein/PAS domain S-box-containing protein
VGAREDTQEIKDLSDALRECRERFAGLVEISSDSYWEQDDQYRFTLIVGTALGKLGIDPKSYLGTTRWEQNLVPVDDGGSWEPHRALLAARQPFRDFVFARRAPDGSTRYTSVSGQPMLDDRGNFRGYRGVSREVTVSRRREVELSRFRAAIDASADLMLLIDRASLRYVDANQAACKALGYSRDELLTMGPQDIFSVSREELAALYDRMFAAAESAPTVQGVYRRKDGSTLPVEAFPRALRSALGDIIVSVARDISDRIAAEAELRAREQRLKLVNLMATSIAAGAPLLDTAKRVLEEVGRILDGARITLWRSAKGGRFVALHSFAGAMPPFAAGQRVEFGQDSVLLSDKILAVPDCAADPRMQSAAQDLARFGVRGFVVAPMIRMGRTFGALTVGTPLPREWTSRELALLQDVADTIALGLLDEEAERNRAAAEAALRASEERFRSLTQLSSDIYWEQDAEHRFTEFSGIRGDRSGAEGRPAIGTRPWEHDYINMTADDWAVHRAVLDAHHPFRDLELCRFDAAGRKLWVSVSGEPLFDASGAFAGYRGVGKNITERKQAEEKFAHVSNHDALTGLPNRTMFGTLLSVSLRNAQRYGRAFALLFIDLDRFQVVNDALGHEAGDELIKEMGARLSLTVRTSDVVARLGGDEFVVLAQEVAEPWQVETVARKILAALAQPVVLREQEWRTTASIGICMYPADAQDERALMRNADIALYRAKAAGKNTSKFYSKESDVLTSERLALEAGLRRALERDEFVLHYQAKLDLATRRITGVEALVRWQHPERGMVPPATFIPLAEETGLIVPIGNWVLRAACAQAVAWQREGLQPLRMAVNLSARQFNDENLLGDIAAALEQSTLAADLLELELTESMVMQDAEHADKLLDALKQTGVRIAIDDFGVGYSSFAHLKRFPIDTLKVDRSFIRDIPQDEEDGAITKAIIAMGKSLNLKVVAEGVETLAQQEFLSAHACDEIQGYYFSKPLPNAQFAELLRGHGAARP